ncbi:unnamed protein product [Triticum aestivum]|uniref:DUF6598 domain-containing protein n=2 Tax=Triticum aestivum TaxID=4565 RepID=A0A9R1JJM9_WHEAT|nr:uncharacterized protein LOC123050750 [Triticum aestivum]KAF7019930.1 hypothetical protein CFC21_033058 [Triticum aestivum]SPT21148.1 unnamed protein product [Triticum aestivum]
MADGGGGGGGECSNLNDPIPSPARTVTADGSGEDVVDGTPPPFKIRKLGAPGTSEAMAARDGKIGERMDPDEAIELMAARGGHVGAEMKQFKCGEVADDELHKDKMNGGKSNQQIKNKMTLEEMDLGKSNSIISEQEIKELCTQMDEMVAFMNYRIIPAAPLICSSTKEMPKDEEDKALQSGVDGILQRLADMRRDMSKLKSELAPFWHEYPYEKESELTPEEEREKRIKSWQEYQKLDNKEKASKEMEFDVDDFEGYCQGLKSLVEHFGLTTVVSPMHFTHYTPRQVPLDLTSNKITLQIFSFKIANIDLDLQWPLLEWPLKVYGLVAARDNVDRRRNILFLRERENFQEITQEKPFLCLTGPSRAILAEDPVSFEVQLKLKGPSESEDTVLITKRWQHSHYHADNDLYTLTLENLLCTTELSLQQLYRESVQATLLRVGGFVKGSTTPFIHGGRLACSSPHHGGQGSAPPTQVVLLDSRYCDGGKLPIGEDGYLDLSRHVVSVELRTVGDDPEELEETLNVFIEAYSDSPPKVSAKADFLVKPQYCGISEHECVLHGSTVKITIAWSPILRTNKVIL